MKHRIGITRSLRSKLLLAHLLVIIAGVVTFVLLTISIAPTLHDRLMRTMVGPMGATDSPLMAEMQRTFTAVFQVAMFQALLLSAGAAILAAVAVSLFVSGRIATPVQRLLTASRRIAAGQYGERVPAGAPDELGALAEQFNLMAIALEDVERRRVELIDNVAHELRTPLATISGYTEGLLDGIVAPEAETWALLHDEVARLRRLVQDLQDVSRAEARQIPLLRRSAAPAQLADQAVAVLDWQFAEKHVNLIVDVPAELPKVQADKDRIVQVLINLLGNALRYTPSGGSVGVRAERRPDVVVFHITDTGAGIAPEHLTHLFERFYRVDPARSRALGGSGIGLTIARALVEAHGGLIWVISPGLEQGATFSFTLPVAGA